jgi:hypothetical protein
MVVASQMMYHSIMNILIAEYQMNHLLICYQICNSLFSSAIVFLRVHLPECASAAGDIFSSSVAPGIGGWTSMPTSA